MCVKTARKREGVRVLLFSLKAITYLLCLLKRHSRRSNSCAAVTPVKINLDEIWFSNIFHEISTSQFKPKSLPKRSIWGAGSSINATNRFSLWIIPKPQDRTVCAVTFTKDQPGLIFVYFGSFHVPFLQTNSWRKPWSSDYGWRLMFERSWVWIPLPYTG